MSYNPFDHYWIVGGSENQVYSSARYIYVGSDDGGYKTWLATDSTPTNILNEGELCDVLAERNIAYGLPGYAAAARYAKETAGITVGNAPIATDRDSQDRITGLWAAAQIDPSISVQFKTSAGFVQLGADQIKSIASALVSHVQACFAAEARTFAGIAAGTVKTTADVDAAFASVT